MKITYAVTVCNEDEQLLKLLTFLSRATRKEDEIIVQIDLSNTTGDVISTVNEFSYHGQIHNSVQIPLDGDFGSFKNNLSKYSTGDWIFQIDADEIPNIELINALPKILEGDDVPDVIVVPRINTVEGITPEHMNKWGWNVSVIPSDELMKIVPIEDVHPNFVKLLGMCGAIISKTDTDVCYYDPVINFPDYQWRLYRNKPDIKWVNKVHEKLSGHESYGILPDEIEWCLFHRKDIARQERQNSFYETIIDGK